MLCWDVDAKYLHLSRMRREGLLLPEPQHGAVQDWEETIDWLQSKFEPHTLMLQFAVADLGEVSPDQHYRPVSKEGARNTMMAYMRRLPPLFRLAEDGFGSMPISPPYILDRALQGI